jgi:hypothetical protein
MRALFNTFTPQEVGKYRQSGNFCRWYYDETSTLGDLWATIAPSDAKNRFKLLDHPCFFGHER